MDLACIVVSLLVILFGGIGGADASIPKDLGLLSTASLKNTFASERMELSKVIMDQGILPDSILLNKKRYKISYTIDPMYTDYLARLLKKYSAEYSAVVVVDNATGEILAISGYERKKSRFNNSIVFSSTHPAASLAKIITAATLLEKSEISNDTLFTYSGRPHAFQKNRVLAESTPIMSSMKGNYVYSERGGKKKNKRKRIRRVRERFQTLDEAFASSNNIVFGRAAIKYLAPHELYDMAVRMGFNQGVMSDLFTEKSSFSVPTDRLSLAELASGYNQTSTINPIHAAILSSVVTNNGIMKTPIILSKIFEVDTNKEVWAPAVIERRVFSEEVGRRIKQMMESTIQIGTGKKSFVKLDPSIKDIFDMGGKSGTITGGEPYGKRDWFTMFVAPKDQRLGKGISISIMNINSGSSNRSSLLARKLVEFYYYNRFSNSNNNTAGNSAHGNSKHGGRNLVRSDKV
ncbi:MAG: hypothetical protein HQK53_02715 [Oligoflexia bacterium]|nr:hypothetical protein [Oligoflexia bacterium]